MTESSREIRKHSRRMWTAIAILFLVIFANFGLAIAHPDNEIQTIIGPIGPSGHDGPQGPAGKDGDQGPAGQQGLTGAIGPQGPVGPQGSVGATGATGADGKDGTDGVNGTNGVNGHNLELRGNDTDQTIEWRVEGDPNWHVLTRYCQLTNTCIPTDTDD